MPFEVTQYQDKPVIISTLTRPFHFDSDTRLLNIEGVKLIDSIGEPVWSIVDFSALDITFSELTVALSSFAKASPGEIKQRVIQFVFVGEDDMASIAAKGVQQDQYGNTASAVFETLDEAIQYIAGAEDSPL